MRLQSSSPSCCQRALWQRSTRPWVGLARRPLPTTWALSGFFHSGVPGPRREQALPWTLGLPGLWGG
eukprot:14545771-Alexandrium_andersonii.AAC.1